MTFLGCTISDGKTAGQKGHALFQKAPPLADAQNTCVGMAGRCTQGGPLQDGLPSFKEKPRKLQNCGYRTPQAALPQPRGCSEQQACGRSTAGSAPAPTVPPVPCIAPQKQRHQQSSGVSSYPFEQRWAKEKQMESSLALTQQPQLFGLELASVRSKDLVGLD